MNIETPAGYLSRIVSSNDIFNSTTEFCSFHNATIRTHGYLACLPQPKQLVSTMWIRERQFMSSQDHVQVLRRSTKHGVLVSSKELRDSIQNVSHHLTLDDILGRVRNLESGMSDSLQVGSYILPKKLHPVHYLQNHAHECFCVILYRLLIHLSVLFHR